MFEDDVDLVDGGQQDESGESKEKAGNSSTAITMAPQEIARVSSTIVREVMGELARNASQEATRKQSATEEWVADMIKEGADPRAVKALLRLNEARDRDANARQQAVQPSAEIDKFNRGIWEVAEEVFDELAENVPGGLEDSKPSLLAKAQRLLMSDPDFAHEQERIKNFQKPSRKSLKLACALVIDKKMKAEGRTNIAMPVDRSVVKAAPPTVSDPASSLTAAQKAFYDQFKEAYRKADKEGKSWQKELLRDARAMG